MIKVNEVSIEGNPDCITSIENGYIVSTYTLNTETREKKGSLLHFENNQIKSSIPVDKGILDTKLIDNKLVSCCSNGDLLITDTESVISNTNITEACLSFLDFNSTHIFSPTLDGNLNIIDRNTLKVSSIHLNPYEIWYVACTESLVFVPVSIGKLQIKDLRIMQNVAELNLHESEISSIVPEDEQVFCGSFDGRISTSDLRSYRKVSEQDVGGGVWRINKYRKGFLTANMEEGFKYSCGSVVDCVQTGSLAYGLGQISESLFIGCSFYDSKLIHLSFPTED